jgi:hypothetical protein
MMEINTIILNNWGQTLWKGYVMKNRSLASTPASIIARITNPAILSVLFLIIVLLTQPSDISAKIKTTAVIILFLVILPLIYVTVRFYFYRHTLHDLWGVTTVLKYHPLDVIILGLVFGSTCLIILRNLDTPTTVVTAFSALLFSALAVAAANLFFKASFHLAFLTVLVILSATIWGIYYLSLLILIPIASWAKYQIREHSVIQLVSGILIAVLITSCVLYFPNISY